MLRQDEVDDRIRRTGSGGSVDIASIERAWCRDRRWVAAILLAHMAPGSELEDLIQEVALTLVRNGHQVRNPESLRPWLRTVAINIARSARRRQRSSRTLPIRSLDELGQDPVDPRREDPPKDGRTRAQAGVARVLEVIDGLPSQYRELLLLRGVRGCTQREIAEILGISERAVESRLARARRSLRRKMGSSPSREWAAQENNGATKPR